MKKILFVIAGLGIGGSERALINLANKLVEVGYDVTILIWNDVTDLKYELDERVHVIIKTPDRHLGNRIPYIRHKLYDDGMWEKRASSKQFYRYFVGKADYDVEIAFFHGMPVKIVSGSTNKNAVHIAWIHNDFRSNSGISYDEEYNSKESYQKFDRIVFVTEEAMQGFKETKGEFDNMVCIHNLIPIKKIIEESKQKLDLNIKKDQFHMVVVGRLANGEKGQIRLINAFLKLREEGKKVSLAIVGGKGPGKDLIYDYVEKNNSSGFITITGNQANPYPLIKEADLLVCSSYVEGYNLTVAEALILGVPVLSTDCAGPNEILDHGKYGMIVENSEEGLYQGIKKLYDDRSLLDEYREKAKERLSFFDEDAIIKQATDLFEKESV